MARLFQRLRLRGAKVVPQEADMAEILMFYVAFMSRGPAGSV